MALTPNLVTISLPVKDLDGAKKYYTDLFGRGPDEEPAEGNIEWELQKGVWLQLNADAAAGTRVLFGVDDIDEAATLVKSVGSEAGEVERYEDVLAWLEFKTPEGHDLSVVQING